jgi:hypothetical protein
MQALWVKGSGSDILSRMSATPELQGITDRAKIWFNRAKFWLDRANITTYDEAR